MGYIYGNYLELFCHTKKNKKKLAIVFSGIYKFNYLLTITYKK